jgi:hypothetical protein
VDNIRKRGEGVDWAHLVQQLFCVHDVSFLQARFNTCTTFRIFIRPPYQLLGPITGPSDQLKHSHLTWIQLAKENDQ